jgi:poly(A) polymerase
VSDANFSPVQVASEIAISAITSRAPQAMELGQIFAAAGYKLALVGGPVRDAILGRLGNDLDFTTDARPAQIRKLLSPWADNTWDIGAEFGTIAAIKDQVQVEITTYRSEQYDPDSRKPEVNFGQSIEVDLSRRDFTINAMALELTTPTPTFIDLFAGTTALLQKRITTPVDPDQLFSDDPLRILRAARFAAQLSFEIDEKVITSMTAMAPRLSIISAERIRDEFVKTLMSDNPRIGLEILDRTGAMEFVLPEISKLKLEIDEHHHHKDVYEHTLTVLEQAIAMESRLGGKNLIIRLAALLHDIGKPRTRELLPGGGVSFHHHEVVGARMSKERLRQLRFDKATIDQVSDLVFLHLRFHGYAGGEWTDSAVRRYVRDADGLLTHLHVLTRADCTTRNQRKAERLAATYDGLEARILALQEQEELDAIRPDLDGNQIMQILQIKAGPIVGKAYNMLLEERIERGPLGEKLATEILIDWFKQQH